MNILNKESPFTPGSPVPAEFFVGRTRQIEEMARYARQAAAGKHENIFLAGDRGIGKSSFASFVRHLAERDADLLGIHVYLGGVADINEMACRVFDRLLKATKDKSWFGKIKDLFGDYIESVGLFDISVSFRPPKSVQENLIRHFPEALHNLIARMAGEKKGLFIVLDDINGLAEMRTFADWYKSFSDDIKTNYDNFPLLISLVGHPERRETLARIQPSLMRIFRVVEIEKLTDEEVSSFFSKVYASRDIKINQDVLGIMVRFANGLPVFMQEIGDAFFWADSDGFIRIGDAYAGLVSATENIGRKYLDPILYRDIRSDKYKAIIRKMADSPKCFSRKEMMEILDLREQAVFDNFLRRFSRLGAIERDPDGGRGAYRFVSELYPMYFKMEDQRRQKFTGLVGSKSRLK